MTREEIREEMLAELQKMAKEIGGTPTCRYFSVMSKTKGGYAKYWLSYNDFVKEAGLLPNRSLCEGFFTKEDLLDKFKELWKQDNVQPSRDRFKTVYPDEGHFVQRLFGSFSQMVTEAGGIPLRVRVRKEPWTREIILEEARKDIKENSLPQTERDFNDKHHIGHGFIKRFFGSYRNMLLNLLDEETIDNITKARKFRNRKPDPMIILHNWKKRYPLLHYGAPVNLKWAHRR